MKKTLLCLLAFAAMSVKAQVNIKVDVAQRGIEISPTLYGIFYEDINYASDGGLYAELIRNRSFEYDAIARDSRNRPSDATSKLDGDHVPAFWRADGANISLVQDGLLNEKQGHALKVETTKANGGISNEGYWGINAVAGTQYKLSFWIDPSTPLKGNIVASLKSKDGKLLGQSLISQKLK